MRGAFVVENVLSSASAPHKVGLQRRDAYAVPENQDLPERSELYLCLLLVAKINKYLAGEVISAFGAPRS